MNVNTNDKKLRQLETFKRLINLGLTAVCLGLEVALTGRDPSGDLLACADYVSEIQMRKHPYEKGIPARKGIEY